MDDVIKNVVMFWNLTHSEVSLGQRMEIEQCMEIEPLRIDDQISKTIFQ